MKYEIKKVLKKKKNNYKKSKDKKVINDLDQIIEFKLYVFLDYYDKNNKNNSEYAFSEKDMKISLDSSIISLFGNINASKILYSLKEIAKETPNYVLEEKKTYNSNLMMRQYTLKTKKR